MQDSLNIWKTAVSRSYKETTFKLGSGILPWDSNRSRSNRTAGMGKVQVTMRFEMLDCKTSVLRKQPQKAACQTEI